MKDDRVDGLIKALEDNYICINAAEALVTIGESAVGPLIVALCNNKDSDVRRKVVWILGGIGDARSVEPLIKALGDSYSNVRASAALVLGAIGAAQAVEPLIMLFEDYDEGVQKYAKMALLKIGTPAVEPLIKALGVSNDAIRRNAAWPLGKIGDARAVEPLIMLFGDSSEEAQKCAEEALVKIGTPAIEPLVKSIMSRRYLTQRCVVKVLDELHWKPKTETENIYYLIAKGDSKSIFKLGKLAVEILIMSLENGNDDVRYYAALALGWTGNTLAVEPLIKALGDRDDGVRKNAAKALNEIYSQLTEIIFGEILSNNSKTSIKNLDTSQLTIPMSGLRTIHIYADTYDFDMVERFITYAINYVGQKHLKKKVEVCIYGNPDKLHPNLLNSFKNMCRKVIIQENKA